MKILPAQTAAPLVPAGESLAAVRAAAAECQACPLWQKATQTVFGEGGENARVMLVGEQPGDQEDVSGKPFVGPAGKLLDRALIEAGVAREDTYVTNAVKHFKWEPRGKRRLHAKPNAREIAACYPWIEAEIRLVKPRVIVCLGATAAQALLGKSFKITVERGRFVDSPLAPFVFATVHPSFLLRLPDEQARALEHQRLVQDLGLIKAALAPV